MLLLHLVPLNKSNENLLECFRLPLSSNFLLFLFRVNKCKSKITLYIISEESTPIKAFYMFGVELCLFGRKF